MPGVGGWGWGIGGSGVGVEDIPHLCQPLSAAVQLLDRLP